MSTSSDKFWRKVAVGNSTECWNWLGHTDRGYGKVTRNRRSLKAHRLAYELVVGQIPEGLTIDHLCRNRTCVNPAHLEAVTHQENRRRARLTHCKNGHEFSPENTLTAGGERRCKTCNRARKLAAYYRSKSPTPG